MTKELEEKFKKIPKLEIRVASNLDRSAKKHVFNREEFIKIAKELQKIERERYEEEFLRPHLTSN